MSPTDPTGPGRSVRLLTRPRTAQGFGEHEVLKSIDLDVRRGEVVTLIGPSGSGKTTVLRCLNGLEVPDAGVVAFAGDLTVDFSAPVAKKQLPPCGTAAPWCSSTTTSSRTRPCWRT